MSSAKIPVSMLVVSVLALTAACAGARAVPPEAIAPETIPPAAATAPASTEPAGPQPLASAATAGVAETLPAVPASEPAARRSPMQALNQMVTSQALLVSLLLAPFSKDAAEQPLARVDAPRAGAPTP
jgi:hypothetical protein